MARIGLAALTAAAMVVAGLGIARAAGTASAVKATSVPLGDGKVTTSGARKGWIYACRLSSGNAPGAFSKGPWIKGDGTYDSTAKAVVDGRVSWPGRVSIRRAGTRLTVAGNGLPRSQTTGTFPIAPGDDAFAYDRNPNSIRAQSVSYSLPSVPKRAATAGCLPGGPIGVATNGVAIFNGLDAGDRDALAWEIQDACGGHPQQQGQYHYHAVPSCLNAGESKRRHSRLVGYALDGFPIYGRRGSGGKVLTNSALDACHGHTHTLTLNGRRRRTYHYHATLEYPYTLGCFRGTATR